MNNKRSRGTLRVTKRNKKKLRNRRYLKDNGNKKMKWDM